jgi:hypothetical protein
MVRTAALFGLGALLGAAAASLGLDVPGARALAFAAAVSLVYVGVDPLLGGDRSSLVALPCGAAHGLAAGAAGGSLALPLAGLAGGIAVASTLLGAALLRVSRAAPPAPRVVSALVAAAGVAALVAGRR